MYTYGFDICAKLCHFSSVDVHVVGMSMLEYSTAVRQWELVYLTALSSGILVIRKKESTGEGKVHTLELTCIVHKHTQTDRKSQTAPRLVLSDSAAAGGFKDVNPGLCSVLGGGFGGDLFGAFPFLSSLCCPHHANILHMRGVMPHSSVLPLMIPSMPTWGVSARRAASCHPWTL